MCLILRLEFYRSFNFIFISLSIIEKKIFNLFLASSARLHMWPSCRRSLLAAIVRWSFSVCIFCRRYKYSARFYKPEDGRNRPVGAPATLPWLQCKQLFDNSIVVTFVWSTLFHCCESWSKRRLKTFGSCSWFRSRITKTSWTWKDRNEDVLKETDRSSDLIVTINKRRSSLIGQILRHNDFIKNVLKERL